ncbi:hypothetical protein K523DRAFT_417730 [Schizophyllum commune Tattone D]|nr:hypothetical protein K523DRAFT_417730 [Schizophyllum commune Tattone D]
MAHMFNAFPIRKRSLAHLEAIAHNILARYIELRSDLGAAGRDAPTMIFVISCAREAHALWLLPSLLYELSTHAPTYDTHSGLSNLSPVDQHAIFSGYQCTQEPHYWDGLVMPGCDRSKCMKKRKELSDATRNRFRQDPMYVADCIWLDCVWKDERVAKLCTLCREGLQHRMRGFAKSFREALPQELKLPGWDELSKECMVDMEGDGVVPRHPMVAPSEIRK